MESYLKANFNKCHKTLKDKTVLEVLPQETSPAFQDQSKRPEEVEDFETSLGQDGLQKDLDAQHEVILNQSKHTGKTKVEEHLANRIENETNKHRLELIKQISMFDPSNSNYAVA